MCSTSPDDSTRPRPRPKGPGRILPPVHHEPRKCGRLGHDPARAIVDVKDSLGPEPAYDFSSFSSREFISGQLYGGCW